MGLSTDPAKRRRQLEGLALGSERRLASLRARLAELDEPGSSEAEQRGSSEATSEPRSTESSSGAAGLAAPAPAGVVDGAHREPPGGPAPAAAGLAPGPRR